MHGHAVSVPLAATVARLGPTILREGSMSVLMRVETSAHMVGMHALRLKGCSDGCVKSP